MAAISDSPKIPFLGMNPFTQSEGVKIDDSPELRDLVKKASKLKKLPLRKN